MSFTGYRIYRGQGGIENVDFAEPVATTTQPNAAVLGLGHEPGRSYCYVVRPVQDGRERPDVSCRAQLHFDESGRLRDPCPARPVLLAARAVTGAVELVWSQRPDPFSATCPAAESLIYLSTSSAPGRGEPAAVVAWSGRIQRTRIEATAGTWHVAVRLRSADGTLSALSAVARVAVEGQDATAEHAYIEKVYAR